MNGHQETDSGMPLESHVAIENRAHPTGVPRRLVLFAAVASTLLAGIWATETVTAGQLDPPGPPAPTMRTLDQVKPGLPIAAADLPLSITTSGLYYLTQDINAAGGGITLLSNDVTIDLMGFTLAGGPGSGIYAPGSLKRVTIRNGRVRGWSNDGIQLTSVSSVVISDVTSSDNLQNGILVGAASRIIDSMAEFNNGTGISVGSGSRISGSRAYANLTAGFSLLDGVSISDSTALSNGASGIFADFDCSITDTTSAYNGYRGIEIGGGIVSGCVVKQNGDIGVVSGTGGTLIEGCSVSGNSGNQIWINGNSATVRGCDVVTNTTTGIWVTGGLAVVANNRVGGLTGSSVGIQVSFGSGSRIDSNTLTSHSVGIEVNSTGNVIVRNSSIGNILGFFFAAGNDAGPVGTASTATSPWANILF